MKMVINYKASDRSIMHSYSFIILFLPYVDNIQKSQLVGMYWHIICNTVYGIQYTYWNGKAIKQLMFSFSWASQWFLVRYRIFFRILAPTRTIALRTTITTCTFHVIAEFLKFYFESHKSWHFKFYNCALDLQIPYICSLKLTAIKYNSIYYHIH